MQRNPTLQSIVREEAGAGSYRRITAIYFIVGSPIHSIIHGICVRCETVHDGEGEGAQLCVAMTTNTSLKQISYALMQAETVRCVCSPTDEKRITCGDVLNIAEAAPSSCHLLAANCYATHNSQPSVVL